MCVQMDSSFGKLAVMFQWRKYTSEGRLYDEQETYTILYFTCYDYFPSSAEIANRSYAVIYQAR